jgi:ribosomal-protein-alanine N-acetyltransferase
MATSSKPSIQIRAAIPADVTRILEIERAAPTAAHWPQVDYDSALSAASPRRTLLVAELVAEIGARVEGFLVARSSFVTEWEIENVVVDEATRRRGLARTLVGFFLEQISVHKPPKNGLIVYLEVRESNLAARQLYEKSGFHLDNRRRAYYRLPEEDALVYRHILQ